MALLLRIFGKIEILRSMDFEVDKIMKNIAREKKIVWICVY